MKNRALLTSALVVGLLIGMLGLYRTQIDTGYAGYTRVVEHLGGLNSLNNHVDKLALESRLGLAASYDELTRVSHLLLAEFAALAEELAAQGSTTENTIATLKELKSAIRFKTNTVERFKMEHSLYRNSLSYLPTAAREFSEAWDGSHPAVEQAVAHMVKLTLVLNVNNEKEQALKQTLSIGTVVSLQKTLPPTRRTDLAPLLRHARLIGDKRPIIQRHLRAVLNDAIPNIVDRVGRQYLDSFSSRVARVESRSSLGLAIMGVLLAILLTLGNQLHSLYESLEGRVTERTNQLQQAMDALWGEMELAKRIQVALLPKQTAIGGFEVAARIETAEKVGGDYYDIIRQPDRDWIVIADVSGHGVESGLVAMMCQTATRAALTAAPSCTPSELLCRVNTVLFHNIRALGSSHYLTISALTSSRDGNLTYSGAHQDILVHRSASGQVHQVPTRGVWLGIKENIEGLLTDQQILLKPNDTLLLHTDGITEAHSGEAMFDVSGLKVIIRSSDAPRPKQIIQRVFSELDRYTVDDDATLVALKKLAPKCES